MSTPQYFEAPVDDLTDAGDGVGAVEEQVTSLSTFQELVEQHPDGLLILDTGSLIRYANPAACELLRVNSAALLSRRLSSLIHPGDRADFTAYLEGLCGQIGEALHRTFRCQRGTAGWQRVECAGRQLPTEAINTLVIVLRDLGTRREQLETLTQLAFTDPVTGLANRSLLMQRLVHRLKRRDLQRCPVGILSLDLDGFKRVNDTYGHAAGDELLRQCGLRLSQQVREYDTVARIGGDEFVVMLEEVFQLTDVAACAERLLGSLRTPIQLDGCEVMISASVGGALARSTELIAEEFLAFADAALYRAKLSGKNQCALYDDPARIEVKQGLTLQAEFRNAVHSQELSLYYQPVVDLHTGRIDSVEALLRWKHPQRGLLLAGELLPLIQQTSLNRLVRQWIQRQICNHAQLWAQFETDGPPFQVTVNLSEEDLCCEHLANDLERGLREVGLAPRHVTLECPERILIDHSDLAIRRMHTWRKLGVGLAIDSFGAQFGSLRLLDSLPIQSVKVDRTLVNDEPGDRSILAAVTAIARDLGVTVTAKCIESPQQYRAALRAQCTHGQGHLFSAALTGEGITQLLSGHQRLTLPDTSEP
jgi:diguanylate cyclase (GGDEF)-like protein/PAS domain S-box-containing protein